MTLKQLEAEMAKHRAGYIAYQAHRATARQHEAEGKPGKARSERKLQEAHRPAYTAYKRAYGQVLALRKQSRPRPSAHPHPRAGR